MRSHSMLQRAMRRSPSSRDSAPEISPAEAFTGSTADVFGTFAAWALVTKLWPMNFTPADATLSDVLQQYWINFVKTGDPIGSGVPAWPTFRDPVRAYLQFIETGPVAKDGLRRAQCDLYIENVNRVSRSR
jgi:carboxylesterase type B